MLPALEWHRGEVEEKKIRQVNFDADSHFMEALHDTGED
jgi:hypothetical protein